jgi:hypothetical protein
VAYHEAGHAVAGVSCRRTFRHATIIPEADSLGHVLFRKFNDRFHPDYNPITPKQREIIEDTALCMCAGAAGAGLLTRADFDWVGSDRDQQDAMNLLSYLDAEPDALGAHIGLVNLRARNVIRHYAKPVKIVAALLLKQRRVGYAEVRDIVYPPLRGKGAK